MTAQLFLIRHGETTLSAEDRFAGSTDAPLSDRGCEQTRRLAHRLAGFAPAAVYASPLRRTLETAESLVIGYYLGIDLSGYRDRLDQRPACLNVLEFENPDEARLTLFNDGSHYLDNTMDEHGHIV